MILTDAQLQFLGWLQGCASPWLDKLFLAVTSLGGEQFYILFLSLLYWAVGPRCGYRVTMLFLVGVALNSALKDLVHTTRPYAAFPDLVRTAPGSADTGGGYAFPSGHAQSTTTVWGALWNMHRLPWLFALAVVVVTSVSFSRMYLGVHWPQDIVGGIALGLCLVCLADAGWRRWESAPPIAGMGWKVALSGLLPLVLLAMGGRIPLVVRVSGVLFGLCLVHVVAGPRTERLPAPSIAATALASMVALLVAAALYLGLGAWLPRSEGFQFLRYALLGAWTPLAALLMRTVSFRAHTPAGEAAEP